MKMWTIQKKSILEKIQTEGRYFPDFKKSRFVEENPNLKGLYDYLLGCYNDLNNVDVDGVIFGFCYSYENRLHQFNNLDELDYMVSKSILAIFSLWNSFSPEDYVILELDYPSNSNSAILPIDINDFQHLMPPVNFNQFYTEQITEQILKDMARGVFSKSPMPTNLVQIHTAYIGSENIVGVYPFFKLSQHMYDYELNSKIGKVAEKNLNDDQKPKIYYYYSPLTEYKCFCGTETSQVIDGQFSCGPCKEYELMLVYQKSTSKPSVSRSKVVFVKREELIARFHNPFEDLILYDLSNGEMIWKNDSYDDYEVPMSVRDFITTLLDKSVRMFSEKFDDSVSVRFQCISPDQSGRVDNFSPTTGKYYIPENGDIFYRIVADDMSVGRIHMGYIKVSISDENVVLSLLDNDFFVYLHPKLFYCDKGSDANLKSGDD